MVIEFVTRVEGLHKVVLYMNDILVDVDPFLIHINGDSYASDLTLPAMLSPASPQQQQSNSRTRTHNVFMDSSNSMSSARQLTPNPTTGTITTTTATTTTSANPNPNTTLSSLSSNELTITSNSVVSSSSNESQVYAAANYCHAALGHGAILCCKLNQEFHYVLNDKNVKGLSVYG